MFNLTIEQLLDKILDQVLFVLVEIIAPQRHKIGHYESLTMPLSFLLQLFKTERIYNVSRNSVGFQVED